MVGKKLTSSLCKNKEAPDWGAMIVFLAISFAESSMHVMKVGRRRGVHYVCTLLN